MAAGPISCSVAGEKEEEDERGEKHQQPRDGEKMLLSSTAGKKSDKSGDGKG